MKLKKLLIPAVLLFLVGGAAKICDTVFNTLGEGFFLSSQACNLTLAAAFLVLYVLAFALSIADRKKSFKTVPTKSMICGVFGFIASVALIGGSVVRILSGGTDNLVESITGIIAGFLLLYESCISFTGMNGMRKMPVAALILPVWGCIRFIMLFVDYTQKSLKATELFDIVAIGFMVMFLFYQSMFFAGINNRLAVRKAVVYGSVFIMLGILLEEVYRRIREKCGIKEKMVTWRLFRILRTFVVISFGRYFSHASGLRHALAMLGRTFQNWRDISFITNGTLLKLGLNTANWIALAVCLLMLLYVDYVHEKGVSLRVVFARQALVFRWLIYIAAVLAILIFGIYGPEYNAASFIYQQF